MYQLFKSWDPFVRDTILMNFINAISIEAEVKITTIERSENEKALR